MYLYIIKSKYDGNLYGRKVGGITFQQKFDRISCDFTHYPDSDKFVPARIEWAGHMWCNDCYHEEQSRQLLQCNDREQNEMMVK